MKHFCLNMIGKIQIEFQKFDFKIWIFGICMLFVIAFVFFDSMFAVIFLFPYLFYWLREQEERIRKERRQKIKEEGTEFFQSLMNCLSAGYSMEESIPIIKQELSMMYLKKESVLIKELTIMERKIQMNRSFEEVFFELAQRCENEDFMQFYFVLKTAKKRGGNLIQILEQTVETIQQKNQAEQEIATILSGRIFEKNIMKVIPVFLIIYLKLFNASYLDVMYQTIVGRICMTICLVIMVIAGKLADQIVDIEV